MQVSLSLSLDLETYYKHKHKHKHTHNSPEAIIAKLAVFSQLVNTKLVTVKAPLVGVLGSLKLHKVTYKVEHT